VEPELSVSRNLDERLTQWAEDNAGSRVV
jgi:hypothetical protein